MHHKLSQSSAILRVFALIFFCIFSALAVMAQEKARNIEPSSQPQAPDAGANPAAGKTGLPVSDPPPRKTNADISASTKLTDSTGNEVNSYKQTLNDLKALYEREVQRLEQQNTQAKGLYRDGLISRIEMEKSDKDLADARAKVEEARNQITAANKPALVVTAASAFVASESAWSTGDSRVDILVRFYGNKYGVDPYLIYCLMHQESKFSTIATSPKGAQGLMQLMPGTAARYGVTNPYDVAQSIMGGTRYLKDLLQMFSGRIDLALAGYNAGENAVIKHGYTVPPYQETRNYVRLIIARYGKKQTSSTAAPAL